jgi:putative addiction module component (TIGR02574 family)
LRVFPAPPSAGRKLSRTLHVAVELNGSGLKGLTGYNCCMVNITDTDAIRRLSVQQRLELMDRIWETLVDEDADLPVPPEVLAEMRRRADELRAHPERGISHEEMMQRLRSLK